MRRLELKKTVKKGVKLKITKTLAKRVKREFRSKGQGTLQYEYSLVKDYILELVNTNPGTTSMVEVYPSEENGTSERF